MSERKTISISVGTLCCIFIIFILVIALVAVCTSKFNNSNSNDENTNNSNFVSEENNSYSEVYEACKMNFPNVIYRNDNGESAGYFIENDVLYSGIPSDPSTHNETIGITGTIKCIIPINKQTGETAVLTEEGVLYSNMLENGHYGNTFKTLLTGYHILEIIELPDSQVLFYLTADGKLYYKDGSLYANLLN